MKNTSIRRDVLYRCTTVPQLSMVPKQPPAHSGLWEGHFYQLKRCLLILAVLSVLPLHNTCTAQAVDSAKIVKTLNKCWRSISREFSDVYGLDDDEVKRYSKQRLCFTPDSISMYTDVLYHPKYAIRKVNAENYAKDNFDCDKSKLDINADSIYEVTILSLTKPSAKGVVHKMTDVIAFDGYCIYVVVDGVIFKLFDADAKVEGRSAN